MNQTCPQRQELVDYLLGKLSADLLQQLEHHVLDCDSCEETLRGLDLADTLNGWVGEAASANEQTELDQDFVANLIQRIQHQSPQQSRLDPLAKERAAEVLRLLDVDQSDSSLGNLGHYSIQELLGVGSSGVVFRAVDEQLGRPVALKVLRPSLGSAAKQRFMVEARSAASVDHANVVTIYQVGELDGLAFIAMQWLPGRTLETVLADVTFMPEQEVRDIARQIAAGLHAAHQKMLIHRDIKPANIWLTESNQVKILDFGLARIADDDPHMTSTGMLAGTPYFMSPEQSRGSELDRRSDLFSLGCLMYRASTGKLPFGEKGILATLQSIQNHHPAPPCELNPNLSSDFSDLTMSLLEKQPANRPESAVAITDALQTDRANWKFNAVSYDKQSTSTAPTTQTTSSWLRWVIAATLIGLLGWGGYSFGQQIIRIATNKGQIVIETNDEDVEVEILSGGEIVTVIDAKTQQAIDITSGEYQIRASDNGGGNSFDVQPSKLIMSRGDKQIVTITRTETQPSAPSVVESNSAQPLFDGKSFGQWMDQLRYEQSLTAFEQGALALGTLSLENPENQRQALGLIRPLIRKHGSHILGSPRFPWVPVFNTFFNQIPVKQAVDFGIEELKSGTSESRYYATILFGIYSLKDDREKKQRRVEEVRDRFPQIFTEAVAQLEQLQDGSTEGIPIRVALSTAFGLTRMERLGEFPYGGPVPPSVLNLMEQQLASSHSAEVKAYVALLLVNAETGSQLGVNEFAQAIGNPDVPGDLRNDLVFNSLALIPNEKFDQTIPGLFAIINSDEMTDELIPGYVRTFETTVLQLKNRPRSSNRIEIRNRLLDFIGNRKEFAMGAMPYLDKIAKNGSQNSKFAEQVAARIRGRGRGAGRGSRSGGLGDAGGGGADSRAGRRPAGALGVGSGLGLGGGEGSAKQTKKAPPVISTAKAGTKADTKAGGKAGTATKKRTYDGRTGQQWLDILSTETNSETLNQALVALGKICKFETEMIEPSFNALVPLLRSGISIKGRDKALYLFFNGLPKERIAKFLESEIKNGNTSSLIALGEYVYRMLSGKTQSDSLPYSREKILDMVAKNRTADDIVSFTLKLLTGYDLGPRHAMSNEGAPLISKPEQFIQVIESALPSLRYPTDKRRIASLIIERGGESQICSSVVCELLLNESVNIETLTDAFLKVIPNIQMQKQPDLVDVFKQVYENEKAVLKEFKRLNIGQIGDIYPWLVDHGQGGGVWVQGSQGQSVPKMNTLANVPENIETAWDVRKTIIKELIYRQRDAEPALPWLEDLSQNSSNNEIKLLASIAIENIKAAEPPK